MNRIKNFFTQKRCRKLLKNNRGFSLLEVLVAVTIIGIISAIAIPQFQDNRETAAKVASDTSATNIVKAARNCIVLNGFSATSCNTLTSIGISCPQGSLCAQSTKSDNSQFCADIKKGTPGSEEFTVCVEVDKSGNEKRRTYGGDIVSGTKVCHYSWACTSDSNKSVTDSQIAGVKTCRQRTECTTGAVTPTGCGTPAASPTYSCKVGNTDGKCVSGECT